MKDIKSLLESTEEKDRLRGIAELTKTPCVTNLAVIRSIADNDESVDVRFYAREALQAVREALKAEEEPGTEEPAAKIDLKKVEKHLHGSGSEKMALIKLIFNHHLSQAAPLLINHLKTENNPFVVSAILKALAKLLGESGIPLIIPYLNHETSRVRADAVEAMELTGSIKGYAFVIMKLNDEDNRVRANAAKILQGIPLLETEKVIRAMARAPQVAFQASAAFVFSSFCSEENAEILEELLNRPDPVVRRNALASLKKMAENGVEKAKTILAKAPSPPEQMPGPTIIEEQLGNVGKITSTLEEGLRHSYPNKRIQAIQEALKQGGLGTAQILLKHFSQEKELKVVSTIILALGKLRLPAVLPALEKCLKHPDDRCRANAVEGIRLVGNRDYIRKLVPLLTDPNNRVKTNAIIALKQERDVDLTIPLREMVQSDSELMQKSAFYTIMELAEEQYFEFLKELARSKFPEVARKVGDKLAEIEKSGGLEGLSGGVPGPSIPCPSCKSPMMQGPENWVCTNCFYTLPLPGVS